LYGFIAEKASVNPDLSINAWIVCLPSARNASSAKFLIAVWTPLSLVATSYPRRQNDSRSNYVFYYFRFLRSHCLDAWAPLAPPIFGIIYGTENRTPSIKAVLSPRPRNICHTPQE
jgi:hypothetical protein